MIHKAASIGLFLVGVLLLSITVYSRFYPVPLNPHAKRAYPTSHFLTSLEKLSNPENNTLDFSRKVTHVFFQSITQYGERKKGEHLGLYFINNWSLFLMIHGFEFIPEFNHQISKLKQLTFGYEYHDYKDALQRGVGLCSQHALAVTNYMKNVFGLESKTVNLNGHVVNETHFPNQQSYVLDADYNVVLPFDLNYAQSHEAVVHHYYQLAGVDNRLATKIAEIFTHKPFPYTNPRIDRLVWITQILNWVIPVILLVLSIAYYRFASRFTRRAPTDTQFHQQPIAPLKRKE